MGDEDKTQKQLMDELAELRQRVAKYEELETKRKQLEEKRAVKIGEILIEMGFLTELQLKRSLKEQEAEMIGQMLNSKRRLLGEIMVESGIITDEQLQSALKEQRRRLEQAKPPEQNDRKPSRRWLKLGKREE